MSAARMIDRRRRLGLTQAEAAARMGVSQSAWSHYETGRKSPTEDTLRRIAKAIGCRVRDLVD